MYAVIETGGKQYRVSPEQTVDVETLPGEIGGAIEFGRVVAIANGEKLLTGDAVKGAKVTGTIEAQARAPKVIVFKFKRKKQYKRTQGHRQNFTRVRIDAIEG
ncbi:MAG TPA: 50S ribosomal protein L21 [Bryobacteraceae bacterium]|jgi:large subunit ribosomal protein L21